MTTRHLLKGAACLVLAYILFTTVSPIDLRPHTLTTVNIDRAGTYALAGLVFVLAYPRHWKTIAVLLVVGALGLEFLQAFSPTRHARLHDALIKAFGSVAGVGIGYGVNQIASRRALRLSAGG